MELFAVAVLALAGANVLFIVVLAVRRLALGMRERRRASLEERLRPLAVEFLESGRTPSTLTAREAAALAVILGRYARRVRGRSRTRIAAFLAERRRGARKARDRRSWIRAEASFVLGDMGSRRHPSGREVARLVLYAFVENVGYRQLNDVWRLLAFVELARRKHA